MMLPYYSYPFFDGSRMGYAAPQVFPAMPPVPQPLPAPAPFPSAPAMQPAVPIPAPPNANFAPMAPVSPFNGNPTMPTPISPYGQNGNPAMPAPVSPYEQNGNPVMPAPLSPFGNPGMPMAPLGPLGNQGLPMLNQGISNIPQFEDDDMEMDFAPSTADGRDPRPVLSDNPAVTRIVLFKELTGFPNYGNPSVNADILYTGNRGSWSFEIPANLLGSGNLSVQAVIRGVLDDHGNVPVNQYAARITINGSVVHNGPVPLVHGVPAGGRFTNWKELTFNISNARRNNRVIIVNTSSTGSNDWIGLDWMELRLIPS